MQRGVFPATTRMGQLKHISVAIQARREGGSIQVSSGILSQRSRGTAFTFGPLKLYNRLKVQLPFEGVNSKAVPF